MIEEIKEDNNCIIKAFENNPISIISEQNGDKKTYYFKASDIGKVLNIVNIRTSIMNFDEDEKVVRSTYSSHGGNQETIYLTSHGVYRVLNNSKKPEAKRFRKWAGNILDDIIFNESKELKRQLDEQQELHQIELNNKQEELEETQLQLKLVSKLNLKKWYKKEPGECVYAYKNDNNIDNYKKIGKAENLKHREDSYMVGNRSSNIFYYKNCYNCKLTERVIHHVLDKFRVNNNKEWFDISDELAIYIIDMVCNFLDGFINTIELITDSGVKESLSDIIIELNKQKLKEEIVEQENIILQPDTIQDIIVDKDDVHFNKFIEEYCEISPDNKCLKLELLGAYRLWNKKLYINSRKNLTTYMKKHYKSRMEFFRQYNTRLSFYIGLKPKDFNIKRENENILPVYEEFILSEYKFAYTYRTSQTTIMNNFKYWILENNKNFIFTKQEQLHMISYLHRTFLNCPKIHISGGVNGYYGLQHKNDTSEINGLLIEKRKEIMKIDIITGNILDTFPSLSVASEKLQINYAKLSDYVLSNTLIDNQFILKYK